MKNNVVTLNDQDVSYRIHLPDADTDYIQGAIREKRQPYEIDMLRDMKVRLSPGDLLLDVGANIGNHSLFLAATSGCRVESFEPNAHLTGAITRSIAENGFDDRVRVHTTAIGAQDGHAAFADDISENLGAMTLDLGDGDIPVTSLDAQDFASPVRMIKIDVEGMELAVLQGADRLLARDRPFLYIEAIDEDAFAQIIRFLEQREYYLWATFNATPTHLFIPGETLKVDSALLAQRRQEVIAAYRHTAQLTEAKTRLNVVNMKYRTLSRQLREAQAEIAHQQGIVRTLMQKQASSTDATLPQKTAQVADVSPAVVAAWTRALPLSATQVTVPWITLARSLAPRFPAQTLALLQASHALGASDDTARAFGFFLIETGQCAQALKILEPLADRLNMSSREQRLLALARTGYSPARARALARTVVRSQVRIATVMDEFTYHGYAPECDLQQLSTAHWQNELDRFQPELVIIESAWRGLDGTWAGKIGNLSVELQGILSWCRDNGVRTAFWNKEDPVHFKTFLTIAQRFDVVFTTDIDCIAAYKAGLGHDHVYLLPFACQPELHNPVELGPRQDAFCFAGAYYTRYPERTRVMDDFVDTLTVSRPFVIYDRNFGKALPEYTFPPVYQPYILGTLAPTEIEIAYKGYTFGINLNSVQFSQTMYARRVYELLACNTRIVSNYALGLRLMFGELTVCTDSGAEALRRIKQQDATGRTGRLKLAGLRKVLSEHTYGHRLNHILDRTGVSGRTDTALPPVTVAALADTAADRDRLVTQFRHQTLPDVRLFLMLAADVPPPENLHDDRIHCVSSAQAADIRLHDLITPGGWLAGFMAADHYGPQYLTDLMLATRYSHASAIGKDAHYHADRDGQCSCSAGIAYGPVQTLALRRCVLRGDIVADGRLDYWLSLLPGALFSTGPEEEDGAFAADPYSYCADCMDPVAAAAAVDDLPDLEPGLSMARLDAFADAIKAAPRTDTDSPMILAPAIAARMKPPVSGDITWYAEGSDWVINSTLGAGVHTYVYESDPRPLDDLQGPDGYRLNLLAGPGINLRLVVIYLDENGRKISNHIESANTNMHLSPPDGARAVRLGLRFLGPGTCHIHGLALTDHYPAPRPIIAGSRVLLVTNNYPSYQNLYRNGFIHSRVRAYRETGGITPDVFCVRPGQDMTAHEFEDVTCITGSCEQLDAMLASGQYDHVLVHFLTPAMWNVLLRHIDRVRVTVWVHGFEIQPWWRRAFNYTTEAQIEKAKTDSIARSIFWRGIFDTLPDNLRLVFVSQSFADQVFADLDVTCPHSQYEVIHNPIDDQLFAYHEKPLAQRAKILSIRPFASPVYANDLTVAAILRLQQEPFFGDLSFHIIGDGRLFDDITAPVAHLPNVTLEKRFLTHAEIAALHKNYGVFLVPSRMDTQGVSRDEAMCSGLVPVTTRIAAIPDFVDENCGYLADPEDAEGLAQAIIDLWHNPDTFVAKSRAAATRVRGQSRKELVIAAELDILQ